MGISRYSLIAVAVCALQPYACFGKSITPKAPASLQPGDTIAIISPASCPEEADVEAACEAVRRWGYVPVKGQHVLSKHGTFAGTIEERLSDLRWAFETPGIKAIVCGRGGYGCAQLLCELPDGYFARHPKWLAGYSDISALHAALTNQGVMSIHSHMCEPIGREGGTDSLSLMLRSILEGRYPEYTVKAHKYNHLGTARGTLVGGNLAVLNDIAASRYDIGNIDDAIIFLEDVDEGLEALNRAIYRLKCAGVLDRARGLILGQFTHAKRNLDFDSPEDMFHEILKDCNIPICFGFPVGHVAENVPLVEGAPVTLTITPDGTTLRYHIK